jgi:hypothetical protein
MRNYYPLINSMGSGSAAIDSDAQAFITAASITDSTQQSAINTLVTDLKGYGIWNKMKAIYPFVGGSASSHKWNLKDPRDLDAAYRLQFYGGWTHSSTGALPNGSTGYADTKMNLNTVLPSSPTYLAYYSRTLQNANVGEMGALDSATSSANSFYLSYGGTLQGYNSFSKSVSVSGISNQTQGYFALNAYSLSLKVFKNSAQIGTTTILTSYNTTNYNVYLAAANHTGTTSYYSSKEVAFSSIGEGLGDAEAANFYTAVQSFQTTLSRQV